MNKPQKEISGVPHSPITVGYPAYIADADGVLRTTEVIRIHSETMNKVVFETRNTVYTLTLRGIPPYLISKEVVTG